MTVERGGHPLDLLSAYLDGELEAEERAALASHLGSCGGCALALEELSAVDTALAEEPVPVVTPGLQRRILDGLPGGASSGARSPSGWGFRIPLAAAAVMAGALALWVAAMGIQGLVPEDLQPDLQPEFQKDSLVPAAPPPPAGSGGLGSGTGSDSPSTMEPSGRSAASPAAETAPEPRAQVPPPGRPASSPVRETKPGSDQEEQAPQQSIRTLGHLSRDDTAGPPKGEAQQAGDPAASQKSVAAPSRSTAAKGVGGNALRTSSAPQAVLSEPKKEKRRADADAAVGRTFILEEEGRTISLTETGRLTVISDGRSCSIQILPEAGATMKSAPPLEGKEGTSELPALFAEMDRALSFRDEPGSGTDSRGEPSDDDASRLKSSVLKIEQGDFLMIGLPGEPPDSIRLHEPAMAERLRRLALETYRSELMDACGDPAREMEP